MRRPEDVRGHIANIDQIESVIVAMRAMAAAHGRDARNHLEAIREHESTIANAMANAIALGAPTERAGGDESGKSIYVQLVVGAAQGFTGTYNENIVTNVLDAQNGDRNVEFLLIGQRCVSEFAVRGIRPIWAADMVARAVDVPALASRIVDSLFERVNQEQVHWIDVVYVDPDDRGKLTVRHLLPFDYSQIKATPTLSSPLLTLTPEDLINNLVEEYVFTEVCRALMLGFAAENDARMNAMSRAQFNVKHIHEDLRRQFFQARQEQTTTEIVELSAQTL